MSDFHTFPSNEHEAIAFLWLKNQNLSNLSAKDIHEMYHIALNDVRKDHSEKTHTSWFSALKEK